MSKKASLTREDYVAFYNEAAILRRDFVDRAWESIKFFISGATPLLVAGITVTIAVYNYSAAASLTLIQRIFFSFLLFFPASAFAITYMTRTNFKRECKHMYEQVAILAKLSEKLGLYEKRDPDKKLYPKDEYYVPDDWLNDKSQSASEFVQGMLKNKDGFFGMMTQVFWVYIIISLFLTAAIFTLIFTV